MTTLNDYIEDKRFVRWALEPDAQTEAYFLAYMKEHSEERAALLKARKTLQLLSVKQNEIPLQCKSKIYSQVIKRGKQQQRDTTISLVRRMIWYAAVAFVFFTLGGLVMNLLENKHPGIIPEGLLVKGAALNTMVYLADGSKKELGDARTLIDFSKVGQLLVGPDSIQLIPTGKEEAVNMVVVPYGKRARLRLSDNSLIELNAGSRLLIPENFAADSRSAYLLGEAFFDITKDPAHPFFLNTTTTEIKVLGTSFHVEAYPDLNEQKTFLKEGNVLLRNSNHSVLDGWTKLIPGEQAISGLTGQKVIVAKGDTEAYSLWKRGIVKINNEPVGNVVAQVERYFNISIHIPDEKVRTRVLTGKMDLNTTLSEVFKYLENITDGKIEKISAGEFVLN